MVQPTQPSTNAVRPSILLSQIPRQGFTWAVSDPDVCCDLLDLLGIDLLVLEHPTASTPVVEWLVSCAKAGERLNVNPVILGMKIPDLVLRLKSHLATQKIDAFVFIEDDLRITKVLNNLYSYRVGRPYKET